MTANGLEQADVIGAYVHTDFITLTRNGAPVAWPVLSKLEHGKVVVSTGYVYPQKAINARRNPRVAAFFSDTSPKWTPDDLPHVLVQGNAEVLDHDLQANTERFLDSMVNAPYTPGVYRILARIPGLMNSYRGYMTRIYIEITPRRELVWDRGSLPLRDFVAIRPSEFTPVDGYPLPAEVETWLPRYEAPPVLAFVGPDGYPAAIRTPVELNVRRVDLGSSIDCERGAPACLTFHRSAENLMKNDAFLIRGHLDGAGGFVPEKVVGWMGSEDDRGVGSAKAKSMFRQWNAQLEERLAAEGRPLPKVRLP